MFLLFLGGSSFSENFMDGGKAMMKRLGEGQRDYLVGLQEKILKGEVTGENLRDFFCEGFLRGKSLHEAKAASEEDKEGMRWWIEVFLQNGGAIALSMAGLRIAFDKLVKEAGLSQVSSLAA